MKKLFTLLSLVTFSLFISQSIEAQDISICFWEDVDGDGADNDGGATITGTDIDLIATGANPDVIAVDQGNGCFEFTGLADGEEYCFDIDPADYGMDAFTISGGDSEATPGTSSDNFCFTWNLTEMDNFTIGVFQFVEICGNVFQDCTNGEGTDSGTDYNNVDVDILDDAGNLATDIDGNGYGTVSVSGSEFCFDMLTPGVEYLFQFTNNDPVNFVPSMLMNDNDMDPATEQTTTTVSGESGQVLANQVDAGYVELISICGVVWEDCNGDGENNDGASAFYNDVDIEIAPAGGGSITMPDGSTYPGPTSINPNDGYCFDGLPPGEYVITMTTTNSDYYVTEMDAAGDAVDSDIDVTTGETPSILIENCAAGPIINVADAGFYQAGCIAGYFWHDYAGEGFLDSDDTGMDGAAINLFLDGAVAMDVMGNSAGSTFADADGYFEFCDLPPGDSYEVIFNLPGGGTWNFLPNNGSLMDTDNNDADFGNNTVSNIVLNTCDNNMIDYIGAAAYQNVIIGGSVWIDQNEDGNMDEDGVNEIVINIYECNDCGGSPLATAVTMNGEYAFSVPPGEYCLEVDPGEFEPGGSLASIFEPCQNASDPNSNVDGDNNGVDNGIGAGGGVIIECAEITCPEDSADPLLNMTFDFCFQTGGCDDPDNFPPQLQDNCDVIEDSVSDSDPNNDLVICDLNILDAFCGSMFAQDTGNGPNPLCSDGGTPHNITWFAFVAGIGDFDIIITPEGCSPGGGGQLGMQAGLYTDCTFSEEVWCESIPCSTEPIDTGVEGIDWTPGQTYYFFFDGCAGSVCDFSIDVICQSASCDPFELPEPDSWSIECPSAFPPCAGGTYDIIVDGYEEYELVFNWTINFPGNMGTASDETNEGTLSYTFDNGPGDYEICFTVNNGCSDQTDCQIFPIVELPDVAFEPIELCGGDTGVPADINFMGIDYVWDGEVEAPEYDPSGSNIYNIEELAESDCGCEYMQTVELTVLPDSEPMPDFIVICDTDYPFEYDGENVGGAYPTTVTIDGPGEDQEIVFEDQWTNGCNVNVLLDVITPVAEGDIFDLGCMNGGITVEWQGTIEPAADILATFTWLNDSGDIIDEGVDLTSVSIPEIDGVDGVSLEITMELFGFTCVHVVPELPIEFNGPDAFELTEDPIPPFCVTTGNAFYEVLDPVDGLTYQWDIFGDGILVTGQGTPMIEVDWSNGDLSNASLLVTAIDACDLTNDFSVLLDLFEAPEADFDFNDNPCPGDVVEFIYTGDNSFPGWTFNWDFGPDGTIVSSTSSDEEGPHEVIFTNGGMQSVTLTVESAPGCPGEITQMINVAEPLPAPSVSCGDSDVDFVTFNWIADPNIVEYSYLITPSNNSGMTMGTSVTEMGLAEGEVAIIQVWGVDINGCVSDTAMIECQALDCNLPAVEITLQDRICEDAAPVMIDTTFTPVFGEIVGVDTIYVNGMPVESGMFDPSLYGQGTHTVTYSFMEDVTGCIMSAPAFTITVDTVPDLVATVVEDTVCITENVIVNLNAIPLNWTIAPDGMIVSGTGTGPYEISFPTPGNKTISVDAANALNPNCISPAQVIDVVVDPELNPANFMCTSTQTSITYSWTVDPNSMYSINDITMLGTGDLDVLAGTYTITNLTQGDVTQVELIVTSLNACPGFTESASCTANPCPTYDITISPDNIPVICPTTPAFNYSATVLTGGNPAMGGTGVWSGMPGLDANTGGVDPSAIVAGSFTISYDYTDDNGCTGQASIDVEVINPVAEIFAGSVICEDDVLTVSAGAIPGGSTVYDWDLDGGINVTPIGAGPFDVMWDNPGVYNITLTIIVDGCTTNTATHQVTVDPSVELPSIDCSPTLDAITFFWDAVDNASGYQIILDGNPSTQTDTFITATGLMEGDVITIEVTALSASSCPDAGPVSIDCSPVPCPDISFNSSASETSVCSADVSTVTLNPGTSGSDGSGSGTWSGDSVDPNSGQVDINALSAGNYTYTYNFSEAGCDFETSISIDVYESPSLELSTISPDCYLNNVGELTVIPTVSTAGFTISINGGAASSETVYSDLAPNQYNVVITDDNGCQATASASISGVQQPSLVITGVNTIVAGQDGGPFGFDTNLDPSSITDIIWTLNGTDILCAGPTCNSVSLTQPMEDGEICVDIFYGTDCVISDCFVFDVRVVQEIVVTNIFSANGQPGNQNMTIYSSDRDVVLNSVQIFDRWGNMVYELPRTEFANGNIINLWDGSFNGNDASSGVYVYSIEVDYGGFVEYIKGDVTVLR